MSFALDFLLKLCPGGADVMTLTATTTASPENVTIDRMTPVGGNITIFWGDGSSTVQAPGDVAGETHAYATAGTYQIRITPASRIQQIDIHVAQLSGFQSAQLARSPVTYFICFSIGNATPNIIDSSHMAAWTPTLWGLFSMPAGTYSINSQHMAAWTPTLWSLYSMPAGTYSINSQHMAAWTPTNWYLYAMPAGTYTIDSADMATWTPTNWQLYLMPAGTYTIDSADMATWTPTNWYLLAMPAGSTTWTLDGAHFAGYVSCTTFFIQDNSLTQAQVDEVLYGLYQATVARTVNGGTINIGGTNAAPSGLFQAAAACPVDDATPGKEVCHELLNDGCAAIAPGETWTTVTFTA